MIANKKIIVVIIVLAAFAGLGFVFSNGKAEPVDVTMLGQVAGIEPDYQGLVVPFNIAPLNFRIKEKADKCFVKVSAGGESFGVYCKGRDVVIPIRKWKALLGANKGGDVSFEIFTFRGG